MAAYLLDSKDQTSPALLNTLCRSMPGGKLDLSQVTVFPFHRSGWRYAMESLMPLHHDEGVQFVGVIEEVFGWKRRESVKKGMVPIRRPWIGIFHNPVEMAGFSGTGTSPQTILDSYHFNESLKYCRGLYCLSNHFQNWLKSRVDVPTGVLFHPSGAVEKKFSYERFLAAPEKRVVQVGAWLRNFISLKHLPTLEYKKICINTGESGAAYQRLMELSVDIYNADGLEVIGEYEMVDWMPDDEFDELLANCVVFLDLIGASANNAVIECIRRGTPVLVNRLPAVEEYLGADYPLYFDSLGGAADKLHDMSLIKKAHEYLVGMDQSFLDGEFFRQSVANSEIYKNLADPEASLHLHSDAAPVDTLECLNIVDGELLHNDYVFIVCMRNQADKIERCISSLLVQNRGMNFGVVLVDDQSDDGSLALSRALLGASSVPFVVVSNPERKYYARNLFNSVRYLVTNPAAICIEVNGDDFLPQKDVLSVLAEVYATGVNKTFGNYSELSDRPLPAGQTYTRPALTRNTQDLTRPWNLDACPSWAHLRTYEKRLFDRVPLHYFLERNGLQWLRMTEDLSIHPKMSALAGRRLEFIDEEMYVYDITGTDHDKQHHLYSDYAVDNLTRLPESVYIGWLLENQRKSRVELYHSEECVIPLKPRLVVGK